MLAPLERVQARWGWYQGLVYVVAAFALTFGAYEYNMGISSVICSNLFLFGYIVCVIECLYYMHQS